MRLIELTDEFELEFPQMVINIKVPEGLAAKAKNRVLSVEAYVEEILAREVTKLKIAPKLNTPEQIRDWIDSLAQFSDKIPPLPEVITRGWIYFGC